MRIAVVVCFLNEATHLPTFLSSMARQTETPAQLLLIDDGSTDASTEIAAAFASEHPWASLHRRPPRPKDTDRLVRAAELLAFQWGAARVEEPWDVIAKLDADLALHPELLQTVRERFEDDPQLGITGSVLSVRESDGRLVREPHPDDHVRGAQKFYRRACYERITPVPAFLGWDTVDELRARMHGWRTASFSIENGESVHLRPTGLHDGRLRALRRWGECAWGYGASPIGVLAGAVVRARRPPYVLSGMTYAVGWAIAGVRGAPRAEPAVRRLARAEQRRRLVAGLTSRAQRAR